MEVVLVPRLTPDALTAPPPLNTYGLPLDNRESYTKLDWIVWTATLADSEADFRLLVAPAYKSTQATPDRVPLTDWYQTTTGKHVGFQACSVGGGVYVKMLADESLWREWRERACGSAITR